jgi:RNA polymerase sigma-70 factor (ECF subfamily)
MENRAIGHSKDMREAQASATAKRKAESSVGQEPNCRVASHDVPEFRVVYEQHFNFVWRSARRLGVPDASVDDVVQDVFVTVYRRLAEFEGRSQLKTWIFGILRHTVRDLRRTQRRKPTEAMEREPVAREHSPLEAAAQREGTKLLHEVLMSLDEDQREVFVLAEFEQLSAPEIGAALELNINTVYSRLRSARQGFDAALKRARSRDEWRMR